MENKSFDIQFDEKVHFWGRLTIFIGLLLSFSIPVYLTFILGYKPSFTLIIGGIVAIIGLVGILWIVEPISYFPILGTSGTYMSFLSGNIGNMKLPVIIAVQNALDLKSGTKKAEIAGIFALVSSTFTNLLVIFIVVLSGQVLISRIPPQLLSSFDFAVPGVLGAMIANFVAKVKPKHSLYIVILAVLILSVLSLLIGILPEKIGVSVNIAKTGISALITIVFGYFMSIKDSKEKKVDENISKELKV